MKGVAFRVTVVCLLLVALGSGCTTAVGGDQSSSPTPTAAQTTPAQPAEDDGGVPYNLSTHCGINPTTFNGRLWDPESVEQGPSPPADPFEPGTMRLEERDHAVFMGESGLRVDFRPAPADTPTPLCS